MNVTDSSPQVVDAGRSEPMFLVALGFMVAAATVANLIAARRVAKKKLDHLNFVSIPLATEFIGVSDAAQFPLTGSLVLVALYGAFLLLPKDLINAILCAYLSAVGIGALSAAVRPILGAGPLIGIVATLVGIAYYITKNWVLNNILAFAICVVGIESVPIKSFKASALLLCALFFYDIFWVFGTDVMVTVATKVDGPIKLLFPQNLLGDHTKKSLLGLGDIVIPGFFLAQMVRFSLIRSRGTSLRYFYACIVAYVASLVTAMAVLVLFDAAQPVLLYIVPYVLLMALGAAVLYGELTPLLTFDEEANEKDIVEGARKRYPDRVEAAERANELRAKQSFLRSVMEAVLSVYGMDSESRHPTAT